MPQYKPAPAVPPSDQKLRYLTACVFVLSAGLILAAARGDLWLDEIWSIMLAEEATSPGDIFFKFQYDNNHVMNTLFQYWMGKQNVLYFHRLPAIAAGIGSLWLVGTIAGERGKMDRLFALLLTGTSFPLILYFSESRGYAPAIFCALLCFAASRQEQPRFNAYKMLIFWIASVVGILSHATFVIVLAALLCLSVVQVMHQHSLRQANGLKLALYYSVPMIFLAGFYVIFIRHIEIGGGPIYSKWDVICRAASLTLGFPEGPLWGPLALAGVAGITAAGTIQLYREGTVQWIFFPVVLFAAPALLVVLARPTHLYFRYFIVCIPFFYLLLGYVAAKHIRSAGSHIRWVLVAAMCLFAVAQAQRVAPLLRLGRGSYQAAVQYILSNSQKRFVGIGSDHDFRNKVLLAFYTDKLPKPKRLYYTDQPGWKKAAPDWIFTHSTKMTYRPPTKLAIADVGTYRLVKEYRSAGFSGWHWFLFRHEKKG